MNQFIIRFPALRRVLSDTGPAPADCPNPRIIASCRIAVMEALTLADSMQEPVWVETVSGVTRACIYPSGQPELQLGGAS
jgi:hypothetical protein